MDQSEAYWLLFTDSLVGNLIINLNNEFIVYSMKIFAVYNHLLIIIIATIACTCATIINYLFGRVILRIFYPTKKEQLNNNYQYFSQMFLKYNILILCLMIIPFWGKFIPFVAGFSKSNFAKVLIVSTIVKLCYYIYYI
jgi:membrane protein YqaA with SNARE-associated domain